MTAPAGNRTSFLPWPIQPGVLVYFRRLAGTTWGILIFTLMLVLSFIFLVFNVYQSALKEAEFSHQRQQQEMAKSATMAITQFLEHLMDDVGIYTQLDQEFFREIVTRPSDHSFAIESWFLIDGQRDLLDSAGYPLPAWIETELDSAQFGWLSGSYSLPAGGSVYYSSVHPRNIHDEGSPMVFLAIIPLSGSSGILSNQPDGRALGVVLNFQWLVEHYIAPLRLGEDDFAWVLDDGGRLIYHPRHGEMVLRSIQNLDTPCFDCHGSFTIQEQMVREKLGIAEYLIAGEPPKLMAYAPVLLGKRYWILAISTYQPSVVKDVFRNSLIIFILSGVFVLLLILTGASLYYLNIRRIRSDEERKHLVSVQRFQDKLDQAAKLASIGELVDSVAHEINTPIGVIASTLDALLIDGKMSHELEDLETIRRQVKRIKGYTRGLLGYSRRLPFNPTENDILEVIEECVFLVRPRIRQKQADFRQHIPQRFAKFVFDRPRIEQVIINLLNNGLDSLEKPGVIELRLQQQAAEDTSESSSWCILEVKDSGAGIPEDQIGKIFDPFFSTKALTEGTGLGLSISKSIVERHRGRITVASKPGQGSTFSVWLPMEVSE